MTLALLGELAVLQPELDLVPAEAHRQERGHHLEVGLLARADQSGAVEGEAFCGALLFVLKYTVRVSRLHGKYL